MMTRAGLARLPAAGDPKDVEEVLDDEEIARQARQSSFRSALHSMRIRGTRQIDPIGGVSLRLPQASIR